MTGIDGFYGGQPLIFEYKTAAEVKNFLRHKIDRNN